MDLSRFKLKPIKLQPNGGWKAWLETRRTSSSALTLYLPRGWPERLEPVRWWRHGSEENDQGALETGQVTYLSDLPAAVRNSRVHVWTPGAETLLTTATVPTRSRAKILQALPFALEEQLLGEPDTMHFAYRPLVDQQLAVAVTAKDRIQAWLDALTQAGLHPDNLCPVTLALPWQPQVWSLALVDDELWLRTDALAGFACVLTEPLPPPLVFAALAEARKEMRAPTEIQVFNAPAEFDAQAWSETLALPLTVQASNLWEHLGTPGKSSPTLNLLQSGFATGGPWREFARALRPAAIMLAILLLGTVLFDTGERWWLGRTAKAQRLEMVELFRKSFPDARAIVDPAAQMQTNLAALQAGSGTPAAGDLLPLLSRAAAVLQSQQQAQMQGLQYGDGALTLELSAPDFQTLEAIKNALTAAGLQAQVLGANSRANAVEGRVRISTVTAPFNSQNTRVRP